MLLSENANIFCKSLALILGEIVTSLITLIIVSVQGISFLLRAGSLQLCLF